MKFQGRITTLELEKDDLEHYRRRVCIRIDNVPVESDENNEYADEKFGEFFREACLDTPMSCIYQAYRAGSEYKSLEIIFFCCSVIQ